MLKIGIIGCGQITRVRHAPEYAENPNCEIAGFYDFDQMQAKSMTELYGGKVYSSVDEMLADDVDAVSVCVANTAHCSCTLQALQAGKHVLCEKPMATSIEDCQAMVAAANLADRILMIGQNQRYNTSHRRARELLAAGEIGRLIGFRLTFGHSGPEGWTGMANPWFYDKTKARFGAMADLGIHKIDLLRYLTQQEVKEVTAVMATVDKTYPDGTPIQVDDNAFFTFRLSGGAVGTVHASWTFYGAEDNSTVLYGTQGSIRIYDDPHYSLVVQKRNGEKTFYQIDQMTTNEKQISGNRENTGVVDAFVESILTGVAPVSSGAEVLHSMEVVFASERSSIEKRTIFL